MLQHVDLRSGKTDHTVMTRTMPFTLPMTAVNIESTLSVRITIDLRLEPALALVMVAVITSQVLSLVNLITQRQRRTKRHANLVLEPSTRRSGGSAHFGKKWEWLYSSGATQWARKKSTKLTTMSPSIG